MLVLVSSAAVTHAAETHPAASQRLIDFNRDVRPILSENCFACHGPDKNKRKAGLRLDLREDATAKLDSGDYAVVPADVTRSALVKVIATDDEEDRMPPKKTGKRLTKAQITLLREWIARVPDSSSTGPTSLQSDLRCLRCKTRLGRATQSITLS